MPRSRLSDRSLEVLQNFRLATIILRQLSFIYRALQRLHFLDGLLRPLLRAMRQRRCGELGGTAAAESTALGQCLFLHSIGPIIRIATVGHLKKAVHVLRVIALRAEQNFRLVQVLYFELDYGHGRRVGSLLDGGRLDEALRRKFGGDTLSRQILARRKSARHVVLSELLDVFELLLRATQL